MEDLLGSIGVAAPTEQMGAATSFLPTCCLFAYVLPTYPLMLAGGVYTTGVVLEPSQLSLRVT